MKFLRLTEGNRGKRSKGWGGTPGLEAPKKRGPGAFRLVCSGRSWAQEEVGQVPSANPPANHLLTVTQGKSVGCSDLSFPIYKTANPYLVGLL